MSVSVQLSQRARNDIDGILDNVSEFTGFATTADKLLAEFLKTFELIAFMPNGMGRLREDGLREAFCRGYRIVYKFVDDSVYIITIIHSRRLYPRL
ncbi:MAG: type II toxin-antitoxin system RelE/ParE family toxin [Pasteurellaceae bacterium]|nr:type II toxin-antitoxin system RelE/ParE family toxin [Pasteurellaceae bacterium]